MQLIFITRSGRNFLSLRLTGWRLGVAYLLVFSMIALAIRAGIAFGSTQGSITDRLLHIWQVSRSDAAAREIGQLKAKIEVLESSLQAIQEESARVRAPSPAPAAKLTPASRDVPALQDLEVRAQKIALALDSYSAKLQRTLAERATGPVMMPVRNAPMSSNYGWRDDPFTGERAFHSGIDWVAPVGTPVFAVADGVVLSIGPASDFGNMVEVRHGDHTIVRYAHLQGIEVTTGMPVIAGQRIARVGSTGRSTGAHLHFEVLIDGRKVNPEPLFARLQTQAYLRKP